MVLSIKQKRFCLLLAHVLEVFTILMVQVIKPHGDRRRSVMNIGGFTVETLDKEDDESISDGDRLKDAFKRKKLWTLLRRYLENGK